MSDTGLLAVEELHFLEVLRRWYKRGPGAGGREGGAGLPATGAKMTFRTASGRKGRLKTVGVAAGEGAPEPWVLERFWCAPRVYFTKQTALEPVTLNEASGLWPAAVHSTHRPLKYQRDPDPCTTSTPTHSSLSISSSPCTLILILLLLLLSSPLTLAYIYSASSVSAPAKVGAQPFIFSTGRQVRQAQTG